MDKPTGNRFVEREWVAAGISAGVLGGILMAIVAGAFSYSYGRGFLAPFGVIDNVFRGSRPEATNWTTTNVAFGLLTHVTLSGCAGGVFAIGLRLVRRLTGMVDAVWAGPAYGLIVWAAISQAFLFDGRLDPELDMGRLLAGAPSNWMLAHVVYGFTLSLTPVLAKLFRTKAVLREEELELRHAA